MKPYVKVIVVSALVLSTAVVLKAQVQTKPPSSPMEDVLTEIRGLRAEINRAAETSLRAQLLVARLQLQEQRIDAAARQLADVQERLRANERVRTPLMAAPWLKALEDEQAKRSAENPQEQDFIVGMFRGQLEEIEKTDRELKERHAYLTKLLTDEQSRWTAFNSRLEDLERTVTVKTPR